MTLLCKTYDTAYFPDLESCYEDLWNRINENHWKSLRITINTMIFRHLCHLALDHWWGGALLFLCDSQWFSAILDDSQWFVKNSEIYLGQFLMICEKPKFLWGNSWWFSMICENSEIYLGQFLVILNDFRWFSMILDDSWKTLQFIWDNFQWFLMILGDSQLFVKNSEISLGAILGDSQWFLMIHKKLWNLFWVILGDSWQFLMILNDLWKLKFLWGDS